MGKLHEGKVALITGGSSGLGLQTAIELAKEGAKIAIVGRKISALEDGKKQILEEAPDAEVLIMPADVSSEDDVKKFVKGTVDAFGRIDYFFNNAGIEGIQKTARRVRHGRVQTGNRHQSFRRRLRFKVCA